MLRPRLRPRPDFFEAKTKVTIFVHELSSRWRTVLEDPIPETNAIAETGGPQGNMQSAVIITANTKQQLKEWRLNTICGLAIGNEYIMLRRLKRQKCNNNWKTVSPVKTRYEAILSNINPDPEL